jgi:hypothetical protein
MPTYNTYTQTLAFSAQSTQYATISTGYENLVVFIGDLYVSTVSGPFAGIATLTFYNNADFADEHIVYIAQLQLASNSLSTTALASASNISLVNAINFEPYNQVQILTDGTNPTENRRIAANGVTGNVLTLIDPLVNNHNAGSKVALLAEFGSIDLQDVSNANNVYVSVSFQNPVSLTLTLTLSGINIGVLMGTPSNIPNTLVQRDGSGNFSAGVITASLIGNVTGNLTGNVTGNVTGSTTSFTGPLSGDVTGTQGATALTATTNGTLVTLSALSLPVGQLTGTLPVINGGTGQNATLTQWGVVYASSISAMATTSPGTAGYVLTSNGTSAPTFQPTGSFGGSLAGDVTGPQTATVVSAIQGNTVSGTTGTGNVVFSTSPTFSGQIFGPVGTAAAPGYSFVGYPSVGMLYNTTSNAIEWKASSTISFGIEFTSTSIFQPIQSNSATFGSSSNTWGSAYFGQAVYLYATGNEIIAQMGGSSSASFPAYGFNNGGGGGGLGIYSSATNTLDFSTASTDRWQISPTGNFLAFADAQYNIGASGANRPLNIYVSNSVTATTLTGNLTGSIQGTTISGTTGTGNVVFSTSPTFTTEIVVPLIYGGTASAGNLTLSSTTNATKGWIYIDDKTGIFVEGDPSNLFLSAVNGDGDNGYGGMIITQDLNTYGNFYIMWTGSGYGPTVGQTMTAGGTVASPTYVTSGDVIQIVAAAYTYNGGSYLSNQTGVGLIQFSPDQVHTNNHLGTRLEFWTTPDNTATIQRQLKIDNSGQLILMAPTASNLGSGANVIWNTDGIGSIGLNGGSRPANIYVTSSISINGSVASACLSANSTTQGFLPPAMTTTQKTAISSPASGLIVFDNTLNALCIYYSGAWHTITSV